jgi:quinol monooxygenase YgiN
MIFVTARMDARPGQRELLERAAKALVAPTAAEQGCLAYELYRCTDREGALLFFECWENREALERHLQQPHLQQFMAHAAHLLQGQVAVTIWEKIAGAPNTSSEGTGCRTIS